MTAPTGPTGKAHRLLTPADGLHTPWHYGVADPGPVGAGVVWVEPVPDATTPTSFVIRQRNVANAAWLLLLDTAAAAPASHAASHADGGSDEVTLTMDQITGLASALAATASAADVAAAVAGLSWKESVRVATTGPGTLATNFEHGDSVDGVTLTTGDRILIKDQADPAENGIYVVQASGAPVRAADADSEADLLGASVLVQAGTAQADTQWVLVTDAPITVGTTGLNWTPFSTGAAIAVQEDGTPKGDFTTLNFVDATVIDAGGGVATVTPTGGGDGGGPIPDWLADSPDAPPDTPGAHDDEGDGTAAWAWRNQGGATITADVHGCLLLVCPPSGSINMRIREQTMAGAFDVRAKLALSPASISGTHRVAALCAVNDASGKVMLAGLFSASGTHYILAQKYANVTTWSADLLLVPVNFGVVTNWVYVRIQYDGTDVTLYVSGNGVAWTVLWTEPAATFLGTPDRCGIVVDNISSDPTAGVFEFVRGA